MEFNINNNKFGFEDFIEKNKFEENTEPLIINSYICEYKKKVKI